ncbi:MAG: hypothetical protein ACE5HC_15665 [Candidatus Binatia bacterium]
MGTRDVAYLNSGQWETTISYRYLHSENLFIGADEQTQVREAGAEPRHTRHSIDLSVRYAFNQRFSATLTIPFIHHSTTFPLGGGPRQSIGTGLLLGDIRIQGGLWLLDPLKHPNGNLAVGLGLKFPTANENAQVTLATPNGPFTGPADIADQPGYGGWDVILEGRGFHRVYKSIIAYASGFYVFSPRNTNDVEPLASLFNPNIQFFTSVPDQYGARAGFSFPVWPDKRLSLSAGGRVSGVPMTDLIGGSDGFRRPGYVVAFEPSVTWSTAANILTVSAPIALKRSILTSKLDASLGIQTAGGQAGFLLLASYSRLF